jgi:prevent-host-death family protein
MEDHLMPQIPGRWTLQDAKASFSEVVRKAQSSGPQHVTVRGKEACVIVSADEYRRLASPEGQVPLVDFLKQLGMPEIDLDRPKDGWRDLDL